MKTLTTITAIAGNVERDYSFVRPYSAKKPTLNGAARMVARRVCGEHDAAVKPSDVSVIRIQHCCYQSA